MPGQDDGGGHSAHRTETRLQAKRTEQRLPYLGQEWSRVRRVREQEEQRKLPLAEPVHVADHDQRVSHQKVCLGPVSLWQNPRLRSSHQSLYQTQAPQGKG